MGKYGKNIEITGPIKLTGGKIWQKSALVQIKVLVGWVMVVKVNTVVEFQLLSKDMSKKVLFFG